LGSRPLAAEGGEAFARSSSPSASASAASTSGSGNSFLSDVEAATDSDPKGAPLACRTDSVMAAVWLVFAASEAE